MKKDKLNLTLPSETLRAIARLAADHEDRPITPAKMAEHLLHDALERAVCSKRGT